MSANRVARPARPPHAPVSAPPGTPLARPPHATTLAGWALLPLRLFLGFTFTFAGLQKLANPDFFNANSPSGIQAQLLASIRSSPLHSLLGHLLPHAVLIGVAIALAEVAVGVGTLLGLCTRVAAAGGMVLAFSLFLTVSFHSSPYYTGADIVFLFAWLPLVVAGSGGVLSLDALIAARARDEAGLPSGQMVPVAFGRVQQVCGHYQGGDCDARRGTCRPAGCPFLAAADPAPTAAARPEALRRRQLVLGGAAVAGAGAVGLVVAGTAAGIGRLVGGAPPPASETPVSLGPARGSTTTTTAAPSTTAAGSPTTGPPTTAAPEPRGTVIGPAHDVPLGGAAAFTDPASGDPAMVLQLEAGRFTAFDAVCPHAGCTVHYSKAANLIVCPCHGSQFNPDNGDVVAGPAPHGLAAIPVAEGHNGQLYVDG